MTQVHAYIVGQAQASYHEQAAVDHPFELICNIAKDALQDAALSPDQIDAIGCVDPFSWTYADLGQKVADKIGAGSIRDFLASRWRDHASRSTPRSRRGDGEG